MASPRFTEEWLRERNKVSGAVKNVEGASPTKRGLDTREPRHSPKPNPYAPYKNKLEQAFAYGLVLEHRAGLIKGWGYEVMTLRLAKGKYHRPDFSVWHLDDAIEQAAVKGYHKNLRDSLTIIKWACKEHPWFRFTINRRDGSAFSKELVEAS